MSLKQFIKQKLNNEKGWLIASISSLILLLLLLLKSNNLRLNYLMKLLVDNFAIGISDAKVSGFLIYFFMFSLLIFLNIKFNSKYNFKKVFLIVLIIGYLLNFFSFVYFIEKYDLDYFSRYDTAIDGRISSTRLMHIHTLKSVFTFFADKFNPNMHLNYDAGLFYYQNLPSFFWILGLFCLFSLIILAILVLLSLKKDLKKDKNFFLTMYILASFSLIKNIFDGGFLVHETILWFGVLLSVLFYNDSQKYFLKKTMRYWLMIVPAYLVLTVLFKESSSAIIASLTILLFISVIYLAYYYLEKKDYLKLSGIFILYLLCTLLLVNIFPQYSPLAYDYERLVELEYTFPEKSIVFLYSNNNQLNLSAKYAQEDFSIYEFETSLPMSVHDLIKKYDVQHTSYLPIKVHEINCDANYTGAQIKEIKILDAKSLKKTIDNELFNSTMLPLKKDVYQIEINYKNSCFNWREVIPRILNKNGLTSFIW